MEANDRQLIKECLKHKREAQKELYDRYAPLMLGICYRYTKSMHDAEEVMQEGFIKVFRHLASYKNESEPGAWIRKIMMNTALDYLKKNQKYNHDLLYEEMPLHAVSDENPEVILNNKELAALIRQLPTGYQTIFNLHVVEGYTHVEIGAMLGISNSTSRSQYARARTLLISWLKNLSIKEQGGSNE